MESYNATLVVDGFACQRGLRRIFAALGFTAVAGGLTTLVGPNGSGKSTLLRALAGLLPIERGDARYGAVSLAADRDAFQELVAYAGHMDAVKPSLSVRENLAFWRAALGGSADVDAVDAALARFGLSEMADAPAAYCSAGQKRRLGLARLAVVDRPVWLLDEPTVSLDTASIAVFGRLVSDHLARGGVAIAATHTPLPIPSAQTLSLDAFAPGRGADASGAGAPDNGDVDPFLDPAFDDPALSAARRSG